eukprot:765731-Hanusia_phi.AAC.6
MVQSNSFHLRLAHWKFLFSSPRSPRLSESPPAPLLPSPSPIPSFLSRSPALPEQESGIADLRPAIQKLHLLSPYREYHPASSLFYSPEDFANMNHMVAIQ